MGPPPPDHLTPTPDLLLEGELLCKQQAELTFRTFAGPYASFVSNETKMPSSMTLLTRRRSNFFIIIIIYDIVEEEEEEEQQLHHHHHHQLPSSWTGQTDQDLYHASCCHHDSPT